MKMFDPHIHMTSRTTDDYERMAAAGIVGVLEPAFWLGQPRTQVGTFVDYFSSLIGWERFRARQFGIAHFCTIALNPKEANDPRIAGAVLELLPRFLEKDGVVGVGEIGYDDITAAEEEAFRRASSSWRRSSSCPRSSTRPHRDKKRGTERSLALVREVGIDESWVLIDHNNEETLPLVKKTGVLGRPLDLPGHQDDRGAHGRAAEEVRHRAHGREQRRGLGQERPAEGAEDRAGDARRRLQRGRDRERRVRQPGRASSRSRESSTVRRWSAARSTRASCSRATRCCAARRR